MQLCQAELIGEGISDSIRQPRQCGDRGQCMADKGSINGYQHSHSTEMCNYRRRGEAPALIHLQHL